MPEPSYKRPQGFRFNFKGVSTADVPDALPPEKYASAKNIRTTGTNSIRTRPGYVPLFSTGNQSITDIRGYTAVNTDALPRLLARDSLGQVWLDNGVNVGNLSGNVGFGASMLPFRPSQSQVAWMYIGAVGDYRKFSAPDANNTVLNYKAGIAEPQTAVDAAPNTLLYYEMTGSAANWSVSGTAGNATDVNRSNNNVGASVFPDPAQGNRYYLSVVPGPAYSPGETASINGNTAVPIQAVFPAVAANNVTIQSIYYLSGSSGNCVIVPSQTPTEEGQFAQLSALQRGSIIQLGGGEVVLVHGVAQGPNGKIAIQTSAGAHSVGESIVGLPSIAIDRSASAGNPIVVGSISSNIATGIGYIYRSFSISPFLTNMGNNSLPQQNDYIHCSLYVDDPTKITQILIQFGVTGNNNFAGDSYYYAVRPSDIVNVPSGNTTQQAAIQAATIASIYDQLSVLQNRLDNSSIEYGGSYQEDPAFLQQQQADLLAQLNNLTAPAQASAGEEQWSEIMFPVSSMTRVGTDRSKTLANCTGMQLQVVCTGAVIFRFGSIWVGGGGQPDVGSSGSSYFYRVVPLSSATGVRGNPSPVMYYGTNPRRQSVLVKTSAMNNSYDSQIDTWEVYRYGGTVTSYRYIGSVATGSDFTDNFFDDVAQADRVLPVDNTEPWPSIDAPWKVTSGNATITATGQYLQVTASNSQFLSTTSRWLPGTLFQLGGADAYTLRTRPIQSGNTYTFQMQEVIGSGAQSQVFVLEPNVAAQPMPYLWGPDEQGYFFGCGDPLRPGTVSWSKSYGPDASPTAYTLELCPPSEPLLGGEVIRGVSVVASSKRWWALYFQTGGVQLFKQLEIPVGHPLVSPFGKASDGNTLFFWSRDGIYASDLQGSQSITDNDLYNLFPHAGMAGETIVRNGVTFYAPDYSRCAQFRLCVRDGLLYATYRDSSSFPRTLVYMIADKAWLGPDEYASFMTVHYAIEQPPGSEISGNNLYPAIIMGDGVGKVWKMQDLHNDNNTAIACVVAPFEWDGGDYRASGLWGDQYVDLLAANNVTVQPVSVGAAVGSSSTISANNNRQFVPVSLGGGVLRNFLGLQLNWTDNFAVQSAATTLYGWQPSFIDKPETITNRYTDWTDFGRAVFLQGFILHADSFNVNKGFAVRSADDNNTYTWQGGPANNTFIHNGEQEKAYSFQTPFVTHMVRREPTDNNSWRDFGVEWIFQPTPETSVNWITQWTALGARGYKHIPRIEAAYSANANVTLTITSYDGTSPSAITLPTTSGVMQRTLVTLTLNKGQLYKFSAVSTANFQIFLNDFIVWVNIWGDPGPGIPYRLLGGEFGDGAKV